MNIALLPAAKFVEATLSILANRSLQKPWLKVMAALILMALPALGTMACKQQPATQPIQHSSSLMRPTSQAPLAVEGDVLAMSNSAAFVRPPLDLKINTVADQLIIRMDKVAATNSRTVGARTNIANRNNQPYGQRQIMVVHSSSSSTGAALDAAKLMVGSPITVRM